MDETVTTSGVLHLAFGAIGFLSLGIAAIVFSRWTRLRGTPGQRVLSLAAGILVIAGFVGGGALSQSPIGVLLLWIAVVAGFAWLLFASIAAYRAVPNPDVSKR
jgi:hypothetical protein